jgi:conjugative transposon TraN protein
MKKLILLAAMCIAGLQTYAQKIMLADGIKKTDLPVVYLPDNLSVHFISPEPIKYVDISSKCIAGDMPVNNILRIKYKADSAKAALKDAVVTIVGEKFMAQYHVIYSPGADGGAIQTDIEISPDDTRPLNFPGVGLTESEMKNFAVSIFSKKPERIEKAKAYSIKAMLNHVYTIGDYVFLDVSYENGTRLKYDIDELRFKIDDKKVTKATNVQSLEIKPDFTLFETPSFKRYYRNIFVFKKFTFPGNKLLHIELSEKQISGRIITLSISYQDILDADTIPQN